MKSTTRNTYTITMVSTSAREWGKPLSLCGTIRERQKQTQFTPTLSTPETLQTRKAVPPSWTVVLCAISCWNKTETERRDKKRKREREKRQDKKLKVHFLCVACKKMECVVIEREYLSHVAQLVSGTGGRHVKYIRICSI